MDLQKQLYLALRHWPSEPSRPSGGIMYTWGLVLMGATGLASQADPYSVV